MLIRPDTDGTSKAVDAKYELIDRGGYIPTGYRFDPVVLNTRLPLEFFEARNAVRIAQSAGAETYAASSYEKAMSQMKRADDLATMRNIDRKELIAASREVVQTADDAREISVKRMDEMRMNAAKELEAAKLAEAQTSIQKRTQARMDAQTPPPMQIAAALEADRATAEAQRQQQNALAESDRNRAIAADASASHRGRSAGTKKRRGGIGAKQDSPLQTQISDSSRRAGSRRTARQIAATIQPHFCHSRHRSRSHREPVGRIV